MNIEIYGNDAPVFELCNIVRRHKLPCLLAIFLNIFSLNPVLSQTPPAQISEQSVDKFGVERKTGRVGFSSPTLIEIGSKDASLLSLSYNHIDGLDLVPSLLPRLVFSDFYDQQTQTSYVVASVQYIGIVESFRKVSSTITFTPEYPTGSSLVQSGNEIIFTDKHGFKLRFGNPIKAEYPDGRVITFNGYSGNYGIPTSVVNNYGYGLKFSNQTNRVEIQAVNLTSDFCDMQSATPCNGLSRIRGAAVDYSPTERTLTDANGGQTKYRFASYQAYKWRPYCYAGGDLGQINCPKADIDVQNYPVGITFPGSLVENITIAYQGIGLYGAAGVSHDDIRVATVTKNGITATYNINFYQVGSAGYPTPNAPYFLQIQSMVNGQQGTYSEVLRPTYKWGRGRSALLHVKDELGRRTNYGFNSELEVSSYTSPEGNGANNTFDARNNVTRSAQTAKTGTSMPDLETRFTYAAACDASTLMTCNKPLTVTDPKGAVAEYTYNSMGQILTETKPAPALGAPRPKVTNSYTMRTAYIAGANGTIVAAGPPISMLTQSSTCNTLSTCAGTSDEVLTTYDYGPTTGLNNLNLRGISVTAVDGAGQLQTLRTCYQYNYFGEKISETPPMGTGSSCP